jgi:hypothetical protein
MRFIVATIAALTSMVIALPASAAPPPSSPEPAVIFGTFMLVFFGILMLLVVVPLVIHIWAMVDVSQGRNEEFGPPWDNSKQAWLMGLAIGFFVPFGHIVAPILWWVQVRGPRKRGEQAGRPFWMQARPMPPGMYGQPGYGQPGYGPPGYGPPGYGPPGYGGGGPPGPNSPPGRQ